ncbi:MAG: response regulator transcription factor [Aristaeellaceae bacterium]
MLYLRRGGVMKRHIMIVEDDPAISRLIESNLLVAGYEPVCAMDGQQALDAISAQHFDLALCDIMLPELDGFELLPYMQERNIPVIYVSAKADVQSRIQGLRLGAEDYLIKPFDILELLVRMEKVLARSAPAENRITYQDIAIDLDSRSVYKGGELIALKPMEYELLCTFTKHPGMVLTREKLLRQVWGDEYFGETRTVDVHVAALRKKLGLTEQLATVYKLGYRLEVPV